MLQFDVALCCIKDNLGGVVDSERTYYTPQAHLSALVTRQAGKVRRYKSEVASGFMPDVPEFVPASEKRVLVRTHVVSTNNNQIRLRRISAFLTLSSLKGIQRRLFMNLHSGAREQDRQMGHCYSESACPGKLSAYLEEVICSELARCKPSDIV